MDGAVLERMISSYLAEDLPFYNFIWQGGEPLLMGIGFYERAVLLQQKYAAPGSVVYNSIQTNATLLDDTMAGFLSRHDFLAGVSIDGPAAVHDRYRKGPSGRGSHGKVLMAIDLLKKHGVRCNAVVLVSTANASAGADTWQYLRNLGFEYQQFIPCVDFEHSGNSHWCIRGDEWGAFLCSLFDAWRTAGGPEGVTNFDALKEKIRNGRSPVCSMSARCSHYFVVEHNGDVYPCDFFVTPEMKLGNISTTSWQQLRTHPQYREFSLRKSDWAAACEFCEYRDLCAGDCPAYRVPVEAGQSLSALCDGWKAFYRHALGYFQNSDAGG